MIRTVRWLISVALRWGGVTAAERTLRVATSTLPDRVNRAQTQVFNISGSTTVYVRGSNCRVTVTRGDARLDESARDPLRGFRAGRGAQNNDFTRFRLP